jgi:hypothetical protein
MKTIYFSIAIFLIATFQGYAQTAAELHGKVFSSDGNTLPGALVVAIRPNGQLGTQTDIDGRFRLKPLDAGVYDVEIKYTGKVPLIFKGVRVDPQIITFLPDATMQDSTFETAEAEVIGWRDPLINKDGSTVCIIRAKELKNMPSAKGGNIKNIVQTIVSDVVVGNRGQDLYFRGSRTGSTLYFIDGVKVRENVPSIPQSGISTIQVYTGGVPAKYGDCTGGVVIIETKSYLEDYLLP